MRRYLRIIGRVLLLLVVAVLAVALWKREEIGRLLVVNSLFTEEKIVSNFSHMDAAFLTVPLPRGDGGVTPLPPGPQFDLPETVQTWVRDRAVTALVILKDGQMVHESYYLGTKPEDRRISWSMAKSHLSALFGILLEEGAFASLDEPVIRYAPQLAGSAYDGATIRNVLNMASGVTFDEDYLDYNSDINKMGRVLALGSSMDGFTAGLDKRQSEPGVDWQYVSIDTHVIGMIIRGATGRSIPDLMTEKLIQPMGLEANSYYLADGFGVAFVLGGLNMTTRDYARFGLMFAQDGMLNGRQIVPRDWVETSTRPSAPTAPSEMGYGYQWWIPLGAQPGEYLARGIYGQYIYIDRSRGVVIAVNAADRGFRGDGIDAANTARFREIAAAL